MTAELDNRDVSRMEEQSRREPGTVWE